MNLRQHMSRQGLPDALEAIGLLRQISAALGAVGDAGIIHRDIKPENILVTRKGVIKVTDFGLARWSEGEHVILTQGGFTMGTPLYMSPEQVNGLPLDQRTDIYSFGITAYHLLAGRPPFQGNTGARVVSQRAHKELLALDYGVPIYR
ncbi:MAG: hypothetical protein CMJ78_06380 [Planctomycetaceae bacterium]|nr:hypothetical protein [Planctomycetaceae bacterium]